MKLDELRSMVSEMFANAEDKTQIESAAKITAKLDEVAAEQQQLLDKNKELLDSYRDVVLHTSVKPTAQITNEPTKAITFEESLAEFMKNNK